MIKTVEKYLASPCACKSEDLSFTDGPWLPTMVKCNKCGVFVFGENPKNALRRWNKCVEIDIKSGRCA